MSSHEETTRRIEAIIKVRQDFEDRALKLVYMRMNDAGISTILTSFKRAHYAFDQRVTTLSSDDPDVNAILEQCIVDAAATMVPDCVDQPFPFLPLRIVKEWVENARNKGHPLDSCVVDVWIADLAVEAIQRRAEKLANGDLP